MRSLIPLVPLLPLLSSLVLMVIADRVTPRVAAAVACTAVGIPALAVMGLAVAWAMAPSPETGWVAPLGEWFAVEGFRVTAALRVDALSLVMAFVITFVGFFIHLYSMEYMAGEEGHGRYFAWLNLFVGAMLLLVLADDLLLLYLGWEGVGLCSYLLIGFWYGEARNGYAARKAFLMTRAGDILLLIGLLWLASRFHTLRIDEVVAQASHVWLPGASAVTFICLLLLGGAIGKSAQVPLQGWLPDAMAGPTPVSALIHAATMVTAGVYLIARLHELFALAPLVLDVMAVIGAVTLLMGALSALVQRDIKRILAWSTISQIGYMFLALGLGAWSAAIFHLFTHAFFKALLFLAAGAVILAAGHEQELGRIGGLRRRLPLVFGAFLAGGASLAALPLVTAGFFSKEWIIAASWRHPVLWLAAIVGAALTAAYVTRLVVRLFFAEEETEPRHRPRLPMYVPLVVLTAGALVAGYMEWPAWLGKVHFFSGWLSPLFDEREPNIPDGAVGVAIMAPFIGALLWMVMRSLIPGPRLWRARRAWREGWGFDSFLVRFVQGPWEGVARRGAGEPFDRFYEQVGQFLGWTWRLLSDLQNGQVRRYAAGVIIGALVLLAVAL